MQGTTLCSAYQEVRQIDRINKGLLSWQRLEVFSGTTEKTTSPPQST